jgi:hypothetical protein
LRPSPRSAHGLPASRIPGSAKSFTGFALDNKWLLMSELEPAVGEWVRIYSPKTEKMMAEGIVTQKSKKGVLESCVVELRDITSIDFMNMSIEDLTPAKEMRPW